MKEQCRTYVSVTGAGKRVREDSLQLLTARVTVLLSSARASVMSRRRPGLSVADHSIENGQQFAHDGHKSNLGLFTGFDKSLVESSDNRIEPGGGQGGHV